MLYDVRIKDRGEGVGEDALIAALNGLQKEISNMRQDQREMFGRIRDIELKQASTEGKEQGSKDIFSRAIAVISAIVSAISMFVTSKGGGHG